MRWEKLFDDLEAQLAAESRLELDAEVADRTRAERAKVTLVERLVGSLGSSVEVQLLGGQRAGGSVADVGRDWLVLEGASGPTLVPTGALVAVHGVARRPRSDASARRLGLGYALRGVSRDRRPVHVLDTGGGRTSGTIDGVGADWLDLSEHAVDEPRRTANVRASRTIPFASVAAVVSAVH